MKLPSLDQLGGFCLVAFEGGGESFTALLATGAVATLAAIAVFRTSDRRAKDRGLLDQTTGS